MSDCLEISILVYFLVMSFILLAVAFAILFFVSSELRFMHGCQRQKHIKRRKNRIKRRENSRQASLRRTENLLNSLDPYWKEKL